jgi:hypothetical protein
MRIAGAGDLGKGGGAFGSAATAHPPKNNAARPRPARHAHPRQSIVNIIAIRAVRGPGPVHKLHIGQHRSLCPPTAVRRVAGAETYRTCHPDLKGHTKVSPERCLQEPFWVPDDAFWIGLCQAAARGINCSMIWNNGRTCAVCQAPRQSPRPETPQNCPPVQVLGRPSPHDCPCLQSANGCSTKPNPALNGPVAHAPG